MSLGKVYDIDEIAYARPVGCGIIIAEDAELLAYAHGRLCEIRHKILRHAIGQLPYFSAWMSANRVEVSQNDGLDGGTAGYDIVNDVLAHLLGLAIGRSCLLDRSIFGDRIHIGLAIDGARRGENKALDSKLRHQVKQVEQNI